jgi:hypothetical protein
MDWLTQPVVCLRQSGTFLFSFLRSPSAKMKYMMKYVVCLRQSGTFLFSFLRSPSAKMKYMMKYLAAGEIWLEMGLRVL